MGNTRVGLTSGVIRPMGQLQGAIHRTNIYTECQKEGARLAWPPWPVQAEPGGARPPRPASKQGQCRT